MNIGRKKLVKRKSEGIKHVQYASPVEGSPISVDNFSFSCSPTHKESLSQSTKPDRRPLERLDKSVSFADDVEFVSKWKERVKRDEWESVQDSCTFSTFKMSLAACEDLLIGDDESTNKVYYQFDTDTTDIFHRDDASKTDSLTPHSERETQDDSLDISPTSWLDALQSSTSTSLSNSNSTIQQQELNANPNSFSDFHKNSHHSRDKTVSTTAEISECVADILEQTMAPTVEDGEGASLNERNSQISMSMATTNEIEECVADILEQTMASDRLIARLCYPNSMNYKSTSKSIPVGNKSLQNDTILSEAAVVDAINTTEPHILAPETISFKTKEHKKSKVLHPHSPKQEVYRKTSESQGYVSSDSETRSNQSVPSMNSSSVSSTSAKQSNAFPDDQSICFNSNTVPLDVYEKIQFLNAEASMYLAQNQFDSAINAFNKLLDFYTASIGENHPAVSSTYHNIGITHSKRASVSVDGEKIEEYNMLSLKAFRKAIHIAEVTMGKNHPSVAVSLVRLGLILLQMGDFEESNSIFQECLKIRKASLGNDHPLVAKVYNNIGVAKLHADKMKEALSAFDSACQIQRCVLEQINISCENRAIAEMELADTLSNICTLCLDLAEKDESVESNSNLVKNAHSAIEEAINIRKNYCNHDDERILQAEGLLNDAKILMDKYLQEEKQEESSNASSYDTAVCDTVISCPSDENLFKNPLMNSPSTLSDMNIESASRVQNWSPVQETGSEVAPLEVACTSVSSIPNVNALSHDFITLKNTVDLEKLSVSRISKDTTNSHGKIERHCDQSTSSNIDTKTVEFKIFDSPIRPQVKEESPSDYRVSFSQIQDENSFLITSDDAISPFSSSPTRSSKRSKWFDEVELAKFPNKYPTQIHELASACLEKGEFDRSLSWFRILLDHYKSEHGELHQNIGATLHNIGIVQMRLEQYDEALLSFQKAVRVRRGAIGRDHADVATSLVKVGVVELLLRRFDSALLTFREALSVRRHALGHLHPSTARIYNNIGCAHAKFNEVREARCAFEAALDVQRNALLYEPENKQLQFAISTTLSNLAHLYTSRGMYEKASMVLAEALSFQESVFSSDHPLVMSTLDTLADTYANFGDNAKALKCYSDILERTKKKGIRNGKASNRKKRATAMLLYKTSRVYRKQNDFEAALRFLQDSFQHADELGIPELSSRIMNEMEEVQKQLREVNYDWV